MNPLLQQRSVLVLNRHWLAVDAVTPAEAFCHLSAGSARALLVHEDYMIESLDWPAWRRLPVAENAPAVGTPAGRVRIPSVLLLNQFAGAPLIVPRFGLPGLWIRDGGRCQYTGRPLAAGEGDIDHVIPRSRGGPTTWENCVLADRRVNRRKGARTPDEAGLRLLRMPFAPRPVPAFVALRNLHRVPAWDPFLNTAATRGPDLFRS